MRLTHFLHVASHSGQTRQHYTSITTHTLPPRPEKKQKGFRRPELTAKKLAKPSNLTTPSDKTEDTPQGSPETTPTSQTRPAFSITTRWLALANHTLARCKPTTNLT
ncbi:hypothetical protein G9A89_001718 [Geosiphon pyriformis]|nr:hypothetical protein G9A89_001718 [Geosiphon pyriformis]